MKLWLMRRTFTFVIVMLAIASNCAFASVNDSNDPNDPNSHNFVWVVALEKEPNDTYWNPTLYKINVEEARVVEKKIAEHGSPIFCYSLPGDSIRVILSDGISSNGALHEEGITEETTTDFTIDKNSLSVLDSKKALGCKDPQEYRNIVLLDKNKKLNIDTPKQFIKKKGDVFIGTAKTKSRAFMLKGFLVDKKHLSLEILDPNTLITIESIPLNVGDRKLGGFFGVGWGDANLIADRYLICLFYGDSSLGTFAPGYVMIVDTELKTVKYVAVGSNPARGIAY